MAFKMRGNPFKQKTENKEELYARIIKENNMKKDEGGYWVDSKGRRVRQILDDVKRQQRRAKIDVDGNLIKE
tara:strand:+ start:313 stop:528 length:216 start_codon:yes stop_codon:yes gene_type:complete